MPYSHRNIAEEQKEACQKTQQVTEICEKLSITIDPVDWQSAGMRAWVTVNTIKIADLLDLSQQDSASILRRVQIKLLEHAAIAAIHARPDLKALIWKPVDVVQPQEFLSLWVLTMETDERIAIAEFIRNRQRVYEQYQLDVEDEQQLAKFFGPIQTGEYLLGDSVTIEEYERKYSGEIIYILPPGKLQTKRTNASRRYHTISGKVYTNDDSSRYLIDCHDGFPHMVNQSQIISETSESRPPDTVRWA
jgi:hypothetical protein